ncbi:MAG: ankyrin repeat domain-containing protein, partial [Gammaproteobacteria bacterium]|nr:ankyrin repeat domain-containing protein [Gammaproteobacteria bacterium]
IRGDALVAEFERASDSLFAALSFQAANSMFITALEDDIQPRLRIGISMGEVVIDKTITGPGVVLAQRLEQLADPGGVCIQGAAYETVPQRLPFKFESLGEQSVKGFEEPVRAYAVALKPEATIPAPKPAPKAPEVAETGKPSRPIFVSGIAILVVVVLGGLAWWQPWESKEELASIERMAFPLPDKPSIAVLPFTNMSDDPKQEYFVDGMTEDLITDISKISGLFVIARNSVFSYKGQAVKVAQVAEELGVRYVLEGSVRKVGNQVRINAQLIDATTGGHLWAERYDTSLDDVFALQDKITQKIVAALSVKLTPEEEKQLTLRYTDNPQAYDALLRGRNYRSFDSPEGFAKTVQYFEKAIELDPAYGQAHAELGWLYWQVVWNSRSHAVGVPRESAAERARRHLSEAMKYPTPLAHLVHSYMLAGRRQWGGAIEAAERAIRLNPNDPDGYASMSFVLSRTGRPAEALVYINEADRLDPQQNNYFYNLQRAVVQFLLEQYDDTVGNLLLVIEENPTFEYSYLLLGASYGHLERVVEGKSAIAKLDELRVKAGHGPYVASDVYEIAFEDEKAHERIREGLYKAGMRWSPRDDTPLHTASYEGNVAKAKKWIERGDDVNAVDKRGFTPLHKAAIEGHEKIAQLLMSKGANVNTMTKRGRTPLHIAVRSDQKAFAELLIAEGANIDAKDDAGSTPLDYAQDSSVAEKVQIPNSSSIVVKLGIPTIIYGERARKCGGPAPSYGSFIKKAVTRKPSHGSLSGGGIGNGGSKKCGGVVPKRAVIYTPESGFVGDDKVVFWNSQKISITVIPLIPVDDGVVIPDSLDVVAVSGKPTIIYGQRAKCGKPAPKFTSFIGRSLSKKPSHGELSGGGRGKRISRRCSGLTPVRAILYTSESGFIGTDTVEFWDNELITITVMPE